MSEFLGESDGASERGKRLPEVAKASALLGKPPDFPTRRERPAPHDKRDGELARVAKDFRAGLARLGTATDKLARQQLLAHTSPNQLAALRQTAPSIARILEREIKTVTQLVKSAPDIKHTATITRAFRERAERVIEQRLPQLYATILKAEQIATRVTPAKVALPLKKGAPVEALVKAARAIRAGRLPFLPLETRKRAQALIDRIFARPRSLETRRSPDSEQRRFIERHSLIPLAVRHDILREVQQRSPTTAPPELVRPSDRRLLNTVNEIIKERVSKNERETTVEQAVPVPPTVTAREMPRVAQPVPSFATQGAAAGGDYMGHTGEDLHVITRNDRSLVEPHERAVPTAAQATATTAQARTPAAAPTVAPAAATAARARAPTARGVPIQPAPAAAAPAPRPPAARPAQGQSGAATGELSAAAGDKPMKIEGTLTIPGMSDWVAEIEGRTKG